MRTVPDNYKLNPGAVEALLERPGEISSLVNITTFLIDFHIQSGEPNQLVVGYTRGLVLLWDRSLL